MDIIIITDDVHLLPCHS